MVRAVGCEDIYIYIYITIVSWEKLICKKIKYFETLFMTILDRWLNKLNRTNIEYRDFAGSFVVVVVFYHSSHVENQSLRSQMSFHGVRPQIQKGTEWWWIVWSIDILLKYDRRSGDLLVLSWAKVRRCALVGDASDSLIEGCVY